MKKRWLRIIMASAVVLLFATALFFFGPGGEGVIDHLILADGSEFMITQEYNHVFGEPYTTEFYMKLPNSDWGWCYMDHEDLRWVSGRLEHDAKSNSVKLFEGSKLVGNYSLTDRTFALFGYLEREGNAPQEYRSPPEKFLNAIQR